MEKRKIVLDTSIFVNPDARKYFGETPQQAFLFFLKAAALKKDIKFFMPPSVYEELTKFFDTPVKEKETIILEKKPPASYTTALPALFIYEFIDETRQRVNKGLRIAEKYTRRALTGGDERDLITRVREEYRIALREGILDSKEDFDLILLSYELKAYLATADQGLVTWAAKLGIPAITAEELKELTG